MIREEIEDFDRWTRNVTDELELTVIEKLLVHMGGLPLSEFSERPQSRGEIAKDRRRIVEGYRFA
jgi:hypothetical protein